MLMILSQILSTTSSDSSEDVFFYFSHNFIFVIIVNTFAVKIYNEIFVLVIIDIL